MQSFATLTALATILATTVVASPVGMSDNTPPIICSWTAATEGLTKNSCNAVIAKDKCNLPGNERFICASQLCYPTNFPNCIPIPLDSDSKPDASILALL
ncbi:hypothetical protein IWQ60_000582 [Tieghemiomyces parasiticus]|uniref:Uncharacterized protein n=1 Tax=Tieghemiomyces parasiticus TaxID=78921 RepID=A0A9W8AIK0_9FUNG|nr:hypothetical protein IWQ60_000582 [Tieghemiomyces parasiticus]